MCLWCSADTATSGRQNTLLGCRNVCSNTLSREKEAISVEVVKDSEVMFLFGARKPIFSGIRSPLGNCYFFIYLFYFVFISFLFFILLLFFFNFIFNLHRFL